jgi:hypothetical protein
MSDPRDVAPAPSGGPRITYAARPRFFGWPLATVVIVLALLAALAPVVVWYQYQRAAKGLLAPAINEQTVINAAITGLNQQIKVVVLTPELSVWVTRNKETRWAWDLVYLGTTTVNIMAPGNRAQYYVPLDRVGERNLIFDVAHKTLTLALPSPILDSGMVEVQSDPTKIQVRTEVGWASFDRYEGEAERTEARKALRQAVLESAKGEAFAALARENCRKKLARFLRTVMEKSGQSDVKVDVVFEGEGD